MFFLPTSSFFMSDIHVIPIEFATPEYDEMVRLRDAILRKPLNLEFSVDYLAKEYNYHLFAAYNAQLQMVGCLILAPVDPQTFKMTQVAVREDQQGNGVGRKMVDACEAFAQAHDIKDIVLHARDVAIPFYEKLDYHKEGKAFTEVGIKHYKMRKSFK